MPEPANSPFILMLLTNAYDPDPRVRQEALALIEMGCRVRILAWDRDRKRLAFEFVEGVEVERVFLSSQHGRGTTQLFFYVLLYLRMLWRGWRTQFDAVHCHDLDTLPLGVVLGKLKRRPVVYDAHESFPDMLEGSVHASVRKALDWLESVLMRQTALVITVGEKLRRHLAGRGARHSAVVGNWKSLSEFSRTPQENADARRKLGLPEDALAVVCITQLLVDRKLEELLTAAERCPDVWIVLGGKGNLELKVREAASCNPRIRYVGFVSGTEIADYTCACDVVYYGFDPANPNARFSAPNKLFEALAAGRPLITGDFGEIAPVVREAACGVVLPEYTAENVACALAEMADRGKRAAMAENASRFGRAFLNWEQGKEILYREYSALLRGKLKQPPAAAVEKVLAGR